MRRYAGLRPDASGRIGNREFTAKPHFKYGDISDCAPMHRGESVTTNSWRRLSRPDASGRNPSFVGIGR